MSKAGYSGKALFEKLGIKPGTKILLLNEPENYFEILGVKISSQLCSKKEVPDLIHLFVKSIKEFESSMKKLLPICKKNSTVVIWVFWYKKASKIPTDMSEDVIRNFALFNGLVDVKVCAVNEIWSGLKLVVPLAKR
jgi:hypothetical protein